MADNKCDYCGKYEMLPFHCKYCGGVYCGSHRLPEYHECPGLRMVKEGAWRAPAFGRKAPQASARKGALRVPRVKLPAQGYYAYIVIAACVLVFILQMALPSGFTSALALSGPSPHAGPLATLGYVLFHPWTLVTYMFLHANVMHIFLNMLVLFFFGPLLERQIGSARFLGLYLGSGVIAGLAQVLAFSGAIVGASAAIMGVMGALTVLMPDLRVFVYFILPLKLVYVTALYALLDILYLGSGDMVAHGAHLIGLGVGLLYGYLIKKSRGIKQTHWPV